MKTTRTLALAIILCAALLVPGAARANGFFIYEASAAGTGMAGAVVAGADDASVVFYNPAAMAQLEGINLQLALTTYIPTASHTSPSGLTESANVVPIPVPAFFATWKPLPWLGVGIGEFTDFGLAIEWPDEFSGAPLAIKSSLQSTNINPSISLGPWKGLSIGGGVDFLIGAVEIKRGYPGIRNADGTPATLKLGGSSWGFGTNAGIHYKPIDMLQLGITYRSQIKIKLDPGSVHFDFPAGFAQMVKDQDITTGIITPQIICTGVRVTPIKPLDIEFDANYVFWSSYRKLTIEFSEGMAPAVSDKNWSDAWQFRLGAQYRLTKDWTLRTGLIYDMNPIPDSTLDPELPDNDRIDWSLGVGYSFWKMRVDLAYLAVFIFDRTVDAAVNVYPGKYSSMVHDISVGVSAHF